MAFGAALCSKSLAVIIVYLRQLKGAERLKMTERGSESIILDDARMAAISSIVGTIAHDFNNLLTPFLAYPQLIKSELPEGASGRALLDVMEKTAKDMVHITQQLLDLASKDGAEKYPVDLSDVVSTALSQLRRSGQLASGITVKTVFLPDCAPVKGSIDQLARVAYNIAINSVEAMGSSGELEIRTENATVENGVSAAGMHYPAGEYARITVADNGTGIVENIGGLIFNPFFTTKKGGNKRGAGLGLSVAYRIVKSHGGYIDFESTPDQLTVFRVYLPVARATDTVKNVVAEEHVVKHEPAAAPSKCSAGKILVVDDEKTILRLFQMILSSSMTGFTIDTATNGEEAVNAFAEGRHSVIIMDLHMPVMDGQAAFFKLRDLCSLKNWEMPAVVFCTGYAPPATIRDVVDGDARHCLLSKPVSGETIVEAVKSRLAK